MSNQIDEMMRSTASMVSATYLFKLAIPKE